MKTVIQSSIQEDASFQEEKKGLRQKFQKEYDQKEKTLIAKIAKKKKILEGLKKNVEEKVASTLQTVKKTYKKKKKEALSAIDARIGGGKPKLQQFLSQQLSKGE